MADALFRSMKPCYSLPVEGRTSLAFLARWRSAIPSERIAISTAKYQTGRRKASLFGREVPCKRSEFSICAPPKSGLAYWLHYGRGVAALEVATSWPAGPLTTIAEAVNLPLAAPDAKCLARPRPRFFIASRCCHALDPRSLDPPRLYQTIRNYRRVLYSSNSRRLRSGIGYDERSAL